MAAFRLAATASIRHKHTDYDKLLMRGWSGVRPCGQYERKSKECSQAGKTRRPVIVRRTGYLRFAHHGDHHRALTSAHIALEMEDLLPCSEQQFALNNGYGQ